jgi:hypothetical protein
MPLVHFFSLKINYKYCPYVFNYESKKYYIELKKFRISYFDY